MTTPESTDSQPLGGLPQNADQRPADEPGSEGPRTLSSADLLQGGREVLIRHDEMIYRLRLTRNGKLILVK
jgi:hemin uptake protein HemP